MKHTLLTFAFVLICLLSYAQKAELVKLAQLQTIIATRDEKIQVVNFWATWCGPCVKEMPLFEKISKDRQDVKVTLVSMDLDLDPDAEKVNKFITRKKILSRVVILDERDANSYINKIDKSWTGALPATLVINNSNGKRTFWEKELHDGELDKLIESVK